MIYKYAEYLHQEDQACQFSLVMILLIGHSNILCQSIIVVSMVDKTFITGESYLVSVYLAIILPLSLVKYLIAAITISHRLHQLGID